MGFASPSDYSEIELFREKLLEFLYPFTLDFYEELIPKYSNAQEIISANGGLDAIVKHDSEVFVDSCYNVLTREFYIASFCSENTDCNGQVKPDTFLSHFLIKFPLKI
jgi:hypothetical protein